MRSDDRPRSASVGGGCVVVSDSADLSLLVELATVDSYAGVLCHHGHRALLLRPSGPPLRRTDRLDAISNGSAKSRPPQAHPSNLTAAEGIR
jgi:hypothetical protein